MSKIRVAVAGAGGIGGTHLQAYAALVDRCQLVGIADAHLPGAEVCFSINEIFDF